MPRFFRGLGLLLGIITDQAGGSLVATLQYPGPSAFFYTPARCLERWVLSTPSGRLADVVFGGVGADIRLAVAPTCMPRGWTGTMCER